jgi:prepilin-type processing-associated H-X9-DG protein
MNMSTRSERLSRLAHSAAGPTTRSTRRCGGTIANVITALVFFGLLVAGGWWIMKMVGQAGEQYGTAMIQTSNKAAAISCQANLRAIGQNLEMYAISNSSFPASQQELMDWSGNSRLFRCPDPNGAEYVYIPGQRPDMPATNVLVYEPEPVHNGRCNVLFLGGQIEMLAPAQLDEAVQATRARLR